MMIIKDKNENAHRWIDVAWIKARHLGTQFLKEFSAEFRQSAIFQ